MASLEHAARGRTLTRAVIVEEVNGEQARTTSDAAAGAILASKLVHVRVTNKARAHFHYVCDAGSVHRVPLTEWGDRWQLTGERETLMAVLAELERRGTLIEATDVLTVSIPHQAMGATSGDAAPKRRIPTTTAQMEQHQRDTGRAHVPGPKRLPGGREGTLAAALLRAFAVPDTEGNRLSCLALVGEYKRTVGNLPESADAIVQWLSSKSKS